MRPFDLEVLQEEVEELTKLLREGPSLKGLRDALERRSVNIEEAQMAGLVEDAEGFESGIIYFEDMLFEYRRNNIVGGDLEMWERIVDFAEAASRYPAVSVFKAK